MRAKKIIRRTAWTLIALATLIALFYAEEDWRGARAWQSAQAEYKKAGESLDYAKFIPPPIPDSQNLGALPIFALSPYSKKDPFPYPLALRHALRQDDSLPDLPRTGNWQRNELPDLKGIQQGITAIYTAAFKGSRPPDSTLTQLETLYPIITELRNASANRSSCRFNLDYTEYPPAQRSLSLLTGQISLTKVLSLHAILALNAHQSDVALGDLRTIFILASGAGRDPSLVGTLVATGMKAIAESIVVEGLMLHAWNDVQLAQLQVQLAQTDILADHQFGFRSEAAEDVLNFQFLKQKPSLLKTWLGMANDRQTALQFGFFPEWPVGWIEKNESQLVLFHLRSLSTVNPRAHRIYPDLVRQLSQKPPAEGEFVAPWNLYYRTAIPSLSDLSPKFAQAQTWLDQSILACGIERYRLAHESYPASLDELSPAYCTEIPRDVINGEPYHYRLLPDGSYRIYSIGWNEKDDGGTLVFKTASGSSAPQIDYDQGDWVWFGAK